MSDGSFVVVVCTVDLASSTDIFKFDPNYIENEERYKSIKAEILGEDSEDEEGSEESESEEEEEEEGALLQPFI